MFSMQPTPQTTRLGFHYYPDTFHYREIDLATWLPRLQALAAAWLTVRAPVNRAIPEAFISSLLSNKIQPILHFQFSLGHLPDISDFSLLCNIYARWGARYVVLFDRPNCRVNWPAAAWSQSNLVERFLDIFQPYALTAAQAGLVPVFPPLEPGGDYWDTAFLRAALDGLLRRNQTQLLERLMISGYAWSNNHSLNWGSGGPERWPATRPYDTPEGSEDQMGFRIFDWYLPICDVVFGERRPMLLLAAGALPDETIQDVPATQTAHTTQNLLIARMMMGEKLALDPIPGEVLACNFWLLAAESNHPAFRAAWYQHDGSSMPVVASLEQWATDHHWVSSSSNTPTDSRNKKSQNRYPIGHYLLLSTNETGLSDWQLDIIRTLSKKYRPTIGFSPAEAVHAKRVTVMGDVKMLPDSILDGLATAGCQVDDLRGDGTVIATKLARL